MNFGIFDSPSLVEAEGWNETMQLTATDYEKKKKSSPNKIEALKTLVRQINTINNEIKFQAKS